MRSEGCPLVLLDIPLLFEGGGGRAVGAHAVAVVSALGPGGEAAQRARVLGRPGMTADKLEAILRRQVGGKAGARERWRWGRRCWQHVRC